MADCKLFWTIWYNKAEFGKMDVLEAIWDIQSSFVHMKRNKNVITE